MAYQNANGYISDSVEILDPQPLAAVACAVHPPIVASFNDRIRPLLDCIDKLRHLNIMQEGIQLPTIVVVGDQSSGKSSVLESLAGISLPRGQGICTRVPLVMRLQNDPNITAPHLQLEYNNKSLPVDEIGIADAIILATDEIAGHGKGISNNPLTLVVKKNGVPDLTMVDLPGITRVAVQGQPADLGKYISLVVLNLTGNNLVGKIPKKVVRISSLSISLQLACNLLRGSFPLELGRLTNLKDLDLSHYKLSGEIPSTLHTCIGLEYLVISNNLFGGRILFEMQVQFHFQGTINYVDVSPSLIYLHAVNIEIPRQIKRSVQEQL